MAVDEVARAAKVSTEADFNRFPLKEDLYLDRGSQTKALISQALERRAPDETSPHAPREPAREPESAVRADHFRDLRRSFDALKHGRRLTAS